MNGHPNYHFAGCPNSGFNSGFPNPNDGSYGQQGQQSMHFAANQNATFNIYIGTGVSAQSAASGAPQSGYSHASNFQAGRALMNAMDIDRQWNLALQPDHPHLHQVVPMGGFNGNHGRDAHPNSHRCLNSRAQQDIVYVISPERQGEGFGRHSIPNPSQHFGVPHHHGASLCPQLHLNGATHNSGAATSQGGNMPNYAFRTSPCTNSNGAPSSFQYQIGTTPPPHETDGLTIESLSQRSQQSLHSSQQSFCNSQN